MAHGLITRPSNRTLLLQAGKALTWQPRPLLRATKKQKKKPNLIHPSHRLNKIGGKQLLVKITTDGLDHNASDLVWASIGSRTTIFKVSKTLLGTGSGDTDRRTTVGNTIRERVNGSGFVSTSKAESIVVAVNGNVLLMALGKLVDSFLDVLHSTLFPHHLSGHVGVKTRAVPFATIYY